MAICRSKVDVHFTEIEQIYSSCSSKKSCSLLQKPGESNVRAGYFQGKKYFLLGKWKESKKELET
jgi:hypothetical protein